MLKIARIFLFIVTGFSIIGTFESNPVVASTTTAIVSNPLSMSGNTLSNPNTNRKIAVSSDGIIYVTYSNINGIYFTRSRDGGLSFDPSIKVSATNASAEVAVSSIGTVYVAWVEASSAVLIKSINKGVNFSANINVGNVSASNVHMATDGLYVYLIGQAGTIFCSSSDEGMNFTSKTLSNLSYKFANVLVDSTGKVIIQVDNPNISYYVSSDHGNTFSAPASANSVHFSTSVISMQDGTPYLLIAGQEQSICNIIWLGSFI